MLRRPAVQWQIHRYVRFPWKLLQKTPMKNERRIDIRPSVQIQHAGFAHAQLVANRLFHNYFFRSHYHLHHSGKFVLLGILLAFFVEFLLKIAVCAQRFWTAQQGFYGRTLFTFQRLPHFSCVNGNNFKKHYITHTTLWKGFFITLRFTIGCALQNPFTQHNLQETRLFVAWNINVYKSNVKLLSNVEQSK